MRVPRRMPRPPAPRHLGPQAPRSPGAQAPRPPGPQVPRCPARPQGAQVPRPPGPQVPSQAPRCPGAQAPRCPDTQVPRCPRVRSQHACLLAHSNDHVNMESPTHSCEDCVSNSKLQLTSGQSWEKSQLHHFLSFMWRRILSQKRRLWSLLSCHYAPFLCPHLQEIQPDI